MNNRQIFLTCLVLVIYVTGSAGWLAGEQWLQYRSARESREILGDIGYQNLNLIPYGSRQDDPNRIHLSALAFFKTEPDGTVVELERWTTLYPSTAWGIGLRQGAIDSEPKWLNHPENFRIDVPLEVGRKQTFTFQVACNQEIRDNYGLNFFFDGQESGLDGTKPGISVYAAVDETGPQDGKPEFQADRAALTQGWPYDPSVPGAGTLVYENPVKGIRVTLTDYAIYDASVFRLDFLQPSYNGYPLAADGTFDPVGQFTLKVESCEKSSPQPAAEPEQKLTLPKSAGPDLLLTKWTSPLAREGFLWVMLDTSRRSAGEVRLYIDSDGDSSLENEEPVTASYTEYSQMYFGPVKVDFEVEGEPVSYHLNFMFYSRSDYTRLYAYSGGWYEGPVLVGDVELYCVLLDQNANGTFDDKSIIFNESDRIRIGPKDQRDTRYVGNYISLNDKLYTLQIARDGAYIELAEAGQVKYGSVQVDETITELAVGGENGLFAVPLDKGKGTLPEGTYRIEHWAIERKDLSGVAWRMAGRGFNDKGNFTITADQVTPLTIGELVLSSLEVRKNGKEHYFNQSLTGSLGEQIEITRSGSRPPAPSVRIKNQDGSYDRKFSFEYG